MLRDLKKILPQKVYEKHIIQYALGKRDYRNKVVKVEDDKSIIEVFYKKEMDQVELFKNEVDESMPNNVYTITLSDKITCDCGFFNRTGMVCRHIFFICSIENVKDVQKLEISDRWLISLEYFRDSHFTQPPNKEEPKDENDTTLQKKDDQILEIQMIKDEDLSGQINSLQEEELPKKVKVSITKNDVKVPNFSKVVKKKGAPKKSKLNIFN